MAKLLKYVSMVSTILVWVDKSMKIRLDVYEGYPTLSEYGRLSLSDFPITLVDFSTPNLRPRPA